MRGRGGRTTGQGPGWLDEGSGKLAEGQRRQRRRSLAARRTQGLMPVIRRAGLERARRLRTELRAAAAGRSRPPGRRPRSRVPRRIPGPRPQPDPARPGPSTACTTARWSWPKAERQAAPGAARLAEEATSRSLPASRSSRKAPPNSPVAWQSLTGRADALSRNLSRASTNPDPPGRPAPRQCQVTASASEPRTSSARSGIPRRGSSTPATSSSRPWRAPPPNATGPRE